MVNDRDDDKGFAIMSRHRYPTEFCRVFERTTPEKLQEALTSVKEPDNNHLVKEKNNGVDKPKKEKTEKHGKGKGGKSSDSGKNVKDGNHSKQATLKIVLGEALGYGPALSEHIILDAGVVPNTKVSNENKLDDSTIESIVFAVSRFEDWLEDIISGDRIPEGYILMQNKVSGKDRLRSESVRSPILLIIMRVIMIAVVAFELLVG